MTSPPNCNTILCSRIFLGTNEPYRMFTSRSEFRLYLRPDNADLRLTPKAKMVGCASQQRIEKFEKTKTIFDQCVKALKSDIRPASHWRKQFSNFQSKNKVVTKHASALDILGDSHYNLELNEFETIVPAISQAMSFSRELQLKIKTEAMYHRFVEDQRADIEEIKKDEKLEIPIDIDYLNEKSLNLSNEEREKLELAKPSTIAAASRIPGVTPSSVLYLLNFVRKKNATAAI